MFRNAGPIEPAAEVGEKVLLIGIGQRTYRLYYVAYIDTMMVSHPLVIDLSAGAGIAAGAQTAVFNTTATLDLSEGQLGQFRCYVLDDINVEFFQPQAVARQGLMNVNARISAFSRIEDPYDQLSEFAGWEDERPFFRGNNPPGGYAVNQARIAFYGYRLILEGLDRRGDPGVGIGILPLREFHSIAEAKASNEKFSVVPVGGWDR